MKTLNSQMTDRSRIMIAALVLVLLLLWASNLLDALGASGEQLSELEQKERMQSVWLDQQSHIEQSLNRVTKQLDQGFTYKTADLMGFLDSLARKEHLDHTLETPTSQAGEDFRKHVIRVLFRNVSLRQVARLEFFIAQQSPYLALESCVLSPHSFNPTRMDVAMKLSAVEIIEREPK